MAKPVSPQIKERVKVSIQPSSDATEEVELDYRLLVTGSFTGSDPGSHKDGDGTLKERRKREIKKKADFKTVLQDLNPKMKLAVPNKLVDDPEALIEIDLDIKDMKDFHPDQIVKNVEPLKKLQEARDRLKQLKLQVLRNAKLKKSLEQVLKEGGGNIDDLLTKLAPAEDSSDSDDKKE